MDTWDNQPTPIFDDEEVQRQMEAQAAADADGGITIIDGDDDDSPIKINDPELRDTVVEGYVICMSCDANNYIRNLGIGDTLTCENCQKEITIGSGNITHSGSARNAVTAAPKERPTSGSLNLDAIGKYKIEKFVALGGMGEVYLGHHPNLDIRVAIKVLSSETIRKHPQMRERFMIEAQIAAKMNHANVCRVYDADMEGDLFYIVMEFIPGGDVLQMAKKEGGRLDPYKALNVIIGVAEALKEAAKFNIVHRDIKPENIMLAEDGTVKLADLGIAKSVDVERQDGTWSTFTNAVLGTPGYIAPEQSMNARDVDCRSDVYSLGATFYHLVTGSLPFKAASPFQMMYKHVKEPLTDPCELVPELPENISAVIKKMMEKAPEDRYQTAAELLVDLYKVRDGNANVDATTGTTPGAAASSTGGGAGKFVAAAVLAVVAILVVVVILKKDPPPVVAGVNSPQGPLNTGVDDAELKLAKQRAALIADYQSKFRTEIDGGNFDAALVVAESLAREMPDDTQVATESKNLAEEATLRKQYHADFEKALADEDFKNAQLAVNSLRQAFPTDKLVGNDLLKRLNVAEQRKQFAEEAARQAAEQAAEEARIAAEKARLAAAEKARQEQEKRDATIKKFRTDFDAALKADDMGAAKLAVDALKRAFPDDGSLYDMQVKLQAAERRIGAKPRIAKAEADYAELANLKIDPAQGFGDRQAAINTKLAEARALFEKAKYPEAQQAAEAVSTMSAALLQDNTKRQAAAPMLKAAEAARTQAVADGGGALPELAAAFKEAETSLTTAKDAYNKGDFDKVAPAAELATNLFRRVAALGGKVRARNDALKALDEVLAQQDLAAITRFAPDQAATYEKERKLGDASGENYDAAAKHYIEAAAALTAGGRESHGAAADAELARLKAKHAAGLAAAQAAYEDGQRKQRAGDLAGMKAQYQAALASLEPILAANIQAVVRNSPAPAMKTDIEEALVAVFARPETGKPWSIHDMKLEMTWIPAGTYTMGTNNGEKDQAPAHEVTISSPFWMGTYEVNQRQFKMINSANPSRTVHLSSPVDSITWEEAMAFCSRLTERERAAGRLPDGFVYRLPTEAEWEYACRAGTDTLYSFGGDYTILHKYGNYRDKSNPAPVSWRDESHSDGSPETAFPGKYQPNKFGLYDMHGNLREWCLDWYGGYGGGSATDPEGPSKGAKKVVRGGAWTDSYQACASAARESDEPERKFYGNGFRVVLAKPTR